MTIQTNVWKGIFQCVSKNLVSVVRTALVCVFAVALFVTVPAKAATISATHVALVQDGTNVAGTAMLSAPVANGHTSVAMDAGFVSAHPEAVLVGGLAGDGQTLDITVINAPSGDHFVGTITIEDETGVVVALARVDLVDGSIEIDMVDF